MWTVLTYGGSLVLPGESHPDRRHTCLPSHRAHTHTHHPVHILGSGSHWDDSCKLRREGLSSVERGAEEKTQYVYIVRGTCHVTQTFTHADVHSRRRSLTQTFTHADIHSRRHSLTQTFTHADIPCEGHRRKG